MHSFSSAADAPKPVPAAVSQSQRGGLQLRDLPSWVPFAMICAFGLLAYGMTLNADFYMDDYPFVLEQETVTGGEWSPPGRGYRQLPYLLWRGVYTVTGESAFAFHALNILAHIGAACALFLAGHLLFRRLGVVRSRRAALIGALVFVVHPFASETVNYARCLDLELVTLFSLLALCCLLRILEEPKAGWAVGLVALSLAAIYSKGPGVFHLVTIIGLVGLALIERRGLAAKFRSLWAGSKLAVVGSALVAGTIACVVLPKFYHIAVQKIDFHGLAYYWEHTLTQGRLFWAYLAKMAVPTGMTSDHLVAWSTSASDLPAVLGLAGAVLLCAAALAGVFTKRFRTVALLASLTFAPIALRFLYPNNELFVEYRAYPALPFVGLLAGLGLSALYDRAHQVGKWAGLGLLVVFAGLSAMRSTTWANAEWLATDSLEKHPLNNRARTQLQGFAYRSGDYPRVFEMAAEIEQNYIAISNAELPHGRRHEGGRALSNLVNSQQLVTFAIAETAGSEKAIVYADRALAALSTHTGLDPESEKFEDTAGSLLEARDALIEHGAENDRRLAGGEVVEPE